MTSQTSERSGAHAPYLSVVVATRNDHHGGDPLKRLQALLTTFAEQCRRASLSAEVIVVEWNPPADRPRVAELCRVPADAPFEVRFIEVPAELHQTLRFASVLPLFQMIAKNAGIRRARGRFILATNIDIIFSNELIDHLASKSLAPGRIYRVDRHDIEPDFPTDSTLAEQMLYCQTHQLRLHTKTGTHPVDLQGRIRSLDEDIIESPGVAFGQGWHVREGSPPSGYYRWTRREARFSIDRRAPGHSSPSMALDIEIEPNPYQPESWVELEVCDGERLLTVWRVPRRMTHRTILPDVVRHDITLRMRESSGGRECLPLFESRDELCYRVCRICVRAAPSHVHDISSWRRATHSSALVVEYSPAGVEISTDPGRYSYAARYGPFEAQADASYEFALEYALAEGSVALSVMDEERQSWLPAKVVSINHDGVDLLSLSVDIPSGTRFSLYVSNNRHRPGVSRFVLRRLLGSVAQDQLRRKEPRREIISLAGRLAAVPHLMLQPFQWLKARASSVERGRAQRFEDTITDESERVRQLEDRLRSLEPLAELVPVASMLRDHRPADLHQNACGDFQLMAADDWFALRGYPEFEMFSMGLDGLFESIAHAAGIKEEVFEMPLCIYHLEHEKGSGWTPEGEAALRKRIAESGITWLDASTVHIWTTYMQWLRRPMIFNGSGWGLGDVALTETRLGLVADRGRADAIRDVG